MLRGTLGRYPLCHTSSASAVSAISMLLFMMMNSLMARPTLRAAEDRWEKTIQKFEAQDRESPPPRGETLFIGSSSIRGWKLQKYFSGMQAINRGFGGSQIADSVRYMSRILVPYQPKAVVFYAGDNDISSGKSPETVLADYKRFASGVHKALPRSSIIFVAIKPSIARWKLAEKMRKANGLIRDFAKKDSRLFYVDIDTPMIGEDGKPRPELFAPDGLHLNDAGYKLWTKLVKEALKAAEKARKRQETGEDASTGGDNPLEKTQEPLSTCGVQGPCVTVTQPGPGV